MDIGVITNPNARKNKARPGHATALARLVGNAGEVVQTRELAAIKPALRAFFDAGCKYVVVDGGDGAFHWALRGALEVLQEPAFVGHTLPAMVPTRGGTIDFVANNAGLTGSAETLIANLRGRLAQGAPIASVRLETMRIDATQVDEGDAAHALVTYGFAVAAGGIGQRFFAKYYEHADPNPRTILRVVGRALASMPIAFTGLRRVAPLAAVATYADELFAPTHAKLTLDGVAVPGDAFTSIHVASMAINLGGVFRVFGKAQAAGVMHALIGAPSAFDIARNLPRLALGKDIRSDDVIDRPCHELVVEATEGQLLDPVIDGEYYRRLSRMRFALGPSVTIPRL